MGKFYNADIKANFISTLLCIGIGPIYALLIYNDNNIFPKCMVGNVIAISVYTVIFWLYVCLSTDLDCTIYNKIFNSNTLLAWMPPISALLCVCCGALFTAAVFHGDECVNCTNKCMIGNVLSWATLLLILLAISCGKCCCGYSARNVRNEEEGAIISQV